MPATSAASPHTVYAQTPIALVRAVLRAYERRHMDPQAALAAANIPSVALGQTAGYVTAVQFERLCAAAMRELDDEALGWFERRLPWGSYGMLARASISAPHLGLALRRWCRHHGLLTDSVRLTLTQEDTRARITIIERRNLGDMREFALLSLLRNLHGLACWFIDSQITLRAAEFPFTAPAHAALYTRIFPGPSSFDAAQASMSFDAGYLRLPLRRDGAALDQMLQHALPILVWPWRRDRLLAQRVRRVLAESGSVHTADTLADALHVSRRTLYRALKREGASLQKLKDDVRRDQACELLLRTNWGVARIARAAGFANEKSFMRAFRGWTGQTPSGWRAIAVRGAAQPQPPKLLSDPAGGSRPQ